VSSEIRDRGIEASPTHYSLLPNHSPSPHPRDMAKPERQRDEADDGGDAGPVDIGALQVLDELHHEKPGHHDERQDDDKSDHATPPIRRLHLISI